MKNLLTGLTITILVALSVFVASQFKQFSNTFAPTPTPIPTLIPSLTPTLTQAPELELPIVKKPAIYLYPTSFIPVSVKLVVKGTITKSIPKYPQNGWYVIANPKGLIDNKYDYLFYEAKLDQYQLETDGWVVATSDLKSWFTENLPKFGLNNKEISQFKSYWLKELTDPGFYEIKLFSDEFLNKNMDLIVNPTPDTIIRVEFYFKHLDNQKTLVEPTIITPERHGFTVVEWGGTVFEK